MALTGGVTRLGTGTGLGLGETRPRGCSGFGTENLFVIGNTLRRLIRVTDIENATGEFASAELPNGIQGLTEFNGAFYVLAQGNLHRVDPPFTATSSSTEIGVIDTNAEFRSLATDGTNLFAYDRDTEAIYRVEISGNTLTSSVYVSVTFPAAVTNPNVLAMFFFAGAFHFVETSTDALYRLPQSFTVGGTAAAARVGNVTQFGANVGTPHGAGVFNDEAYMVDGSVRTLFRFYNVRWDATIDAIEVDEGGNGSLDLNTVSQDAASFEFAPSNTSRSWVTLSGTELVITNAPDVTADTDFNPVVRGLRDGAYEDTPLTVTVRDTTPPPLNPPTFTEPATNYEVNERANETIDATEFFTGHTSLAFQTDYTPPSWVTISGLNVVITGAPDVVEDTDFTVPLTATNSDGSVNGSITVSVQQIDPAPIFGTPDVHEVNEGGSSTVDLSGDLQNIESLAYQSGYTPPSWVSISGLTLVITNAQLVSQDTDFDVLLTAESTKTAATADGTVTIRVRDVAPPPPQVRAVPPLSNAPIDLKVELTPTTAWISWKAPTNGASLTGYEINYAEGSTPGTTWIPTESRSTRFFVKGLKRSTQYTWQVRGVNDMGTGQASSPVTEYTPIASLHNTIFFKECVNYFDKGVRVSVHGDPTNLVRAVADNDYNTFTREKDLNINIAVNGQPTRVDAILVKGIDIERHSAEPTGGSGSGYTHRMMPATVKNWEGTEVSTVVAGFQHDLYLLSPHFTATSVRLTFTGANAKIYESYAFGVRN